MELYRDITGYRIQQIQTTDCKKMCQIKQWQKKWWKVRRKIIGIDYSGRETGKRSTWLPVILQLIDVLSPLVL